MDEGLPESWMVLEPGTAVYASDGARIGEVKEVLAVPDEDIFEGIICKTPHGDRYVDAELIDSIHERGVDLKVDGEAAANLPQPKPAPGAMEVGVDDVSEASGPYKRQNWFKRTWDRLSGNY